MDAVYLGAPSSLLYPPGSTNLETALDHAVALYSINGPDAGQGVLLNGLGVRRYGPEPRRLHVQLPRVRGRRRVPMSRNS